MLFASSSCLIIELIVILSKRVFFNIQSFILLALSENGKPMLMRQKMYSFVNKDSPIGGGLEMPTLSIQVREGGRVWDMEKRAHHFINVLNKI